MNLTLWLAAALGGLLSLGGAAYSGYSYGLDVQLARDKAEQVKEFGTVIKNLEKARDDAKTAYETQVINAERYARDIGEARAKVQVITKEIPKYVAANPAPRSCDIADWLFVAFNQAAAETRKPPVHAN